MSMKSNIGEIFFGGYFKKFHLFIKSLLIKKHIILTLIFQLSQPMTIINIFTFSQVLFYNFSSVLFRWLVLS